MSKFKEFFIFLASILYKVNRWYDKQDVNKRELLIVVVMVLIVAIKPILSAALAILFLLIRGIHINGLWFEWSDVEAVDDQEQL